jgi:hypothetical protein
MVTKLVAGAEIRDITIMISSAVKIKTYISESYNKYLNMHRETTEFLRRVLPYY